MATQMRQALAGICRARRLDLDVTQRELAASLGISRSHYAAIESAQGNPTIDLVDRIGQALGLHLDLIASPDVTVLRARVRDAVHARCSGYVTRRLTAAGWLVLREVEIADGRLRGWIDIVAYDPRNRTLLVIELKTVIDDIGRLERQVGWYERNVASVVPAAWTPSRRCRWVLVLATAEVDQAMAHHRDVLATAFPARATEMRATLAGAEPRSGSGLALIDPRSRRRDWLIPSRVDGRRTPAPYQDLRAAIRSLEG